ncbi:sulfotransferase family protein [Sphingoaurantiacus capsulatus]|uniref:Sulfotransferase family protein n=1 Tax=Sphingoaurantiacus capsulatus TaxID=1771310 RepID=A0ABV7XH37_9SPHN
MPLPPATAYRPTLVRHANAALPKLWDKRWLPPPDLLEETLDRQAMQATGLCDFGDPWFRGPLRVLLPALREEARLNAMGRLIAHGSLLKMLKERLRAQAWFTAHPDIRERPLPAPVVIVGPMRSGTTRLHRLLATDDRFAHLRLYEAMCPVPPRGRDTRALQTAFGLKAINWINPANAAVHPTGPHQADEELGLLENSAWGAQIEAQRRVPGYARWCEAQDATPAYRHMADLLRLTGWRRGDNPATPWLLKTPQHMQDLPALLAVFPDARLIFTHRDPASVVGSAASLAWHQMVVQSDEVDAHWVGAEWLHKTAHRIEKTLAVRAALPAARQLDLTFDEMNRDWRGTIRRVYAFLGLDLEPALPAMETYLTRENRHAAHRYDLADFGLNADAIRERFSSYSARFLA